MSTLPTVCMHRATSLCACTEQTAYCVHAPSHFTVCMHRADCLLCVQGRVSHENLSDRGKERDKIFDEMQLKDVVQGERWLCQAAVSGANFCKLQE